MNETGQLYIRKYNLTYVYNFAWKAEFANVGMIDGHPSFE